jgi:hypothetical protein
MDISMVDVYTVTDPRTGMARNRIFPSNPFGCRNNPNIYTQWHHENIKVNHPCACVFMHASS